MSARLASSLYEPAIVATLRRFWDRGAPMSLLVRIAGSSRNWRLLNDWWAIDGSTGGARAWHHSEPSPIEGEPLLVLSGPERRIALVQLADWFAAARRPWPSQAALARYFGVSQRQIQWDLAALRDRGEIPARLIEVQDAA